MFGMDDLPDLIDVNDTEAMEDLGRILDLGELAGGPVVTEGMTERDTEVAWFLWVHAQEEIDAAIVEGLEYLNAGGKFH